MSTRLGGNCVNDRPDFLAEKSEQSTKFGHVSADRSGCIALTVPYCNHEIEDCYIEIHIRRRTTEGNCADLCAIFDFRAACGSKLIIPVHHGRIGTAKIHANL